MVRERFDTLRLEMIASDLRTAGRTDDAQHVINAVKLITRLESVLEDVQQAMEKYRERQ